MPPASPVAADRTRVVNVRREACDHYIGRALPGKAGSPFANPFRIGADGDRATVIGRYREHLEQLLAGRPDLVDQLQAMRGSRLGCWCAPQACHGDVLAQWLDGPVPVVEPAQPSLF